MLQRERVHGDDLLALVLSWPYHPPTHSFEVLVAARALQGVFGALLAPAALSILTTTFTDPAERGKAFGILGAVAVGGAAIGLILGGVLTQYLNWRWCLYVNLAFAVRAMLAATAAS